MGFQKFGTGDIIGEDGALIGAHVSEPQDPEKQKALVEEDARLAKLVSEKIEEHRPE